MCFIAAPVRRLRPPTSCFSLSRGKVVAEEYLIARWAAGELCGAGFNCPLPLKVREKLLSEKEQRKAAYKKEYELKKARNYIAKYGKLP